jgi:hypothetical protein
MWKKETTRLNERKRRVLPKDLLTWAILFRISMPMITGEGLRQSYKIGLLIQPNKSGGKLSVLRVKRFSKHKKNIKRFERNTASIANWSKKLNL